MIVLTGAAGFIGSCILSVLNASGKKDIVIVDELAGDADPKKKNLAGKEFTDFFDKKDFIKLIRDDKVKGNIDCVIHMGACSSTTLQDAQYFEENNFLYSRDLAKWCLKRKVRLIYASSAATYGDGSGGYNDADESTRRCRPLNLYGESKQKFDLWVLDNGVIDKVVGLKFFNVFGPNEYHKGDMQSVVAKAYTRVASEGTMSLFKSYKKEYAHGEQKRDFIYIKDAVDIVMYFLNNSTLHGIYNVGTGKARTWNDLAGALFSSVGKKPNIEYVDMPPGLEQRYQYFTQADMEKLRKTGYKKAMMTLEDSIKDYGKYLSQHAYL
ncbi:MAG: ADP-glyceromanno-heptose 6-epimerase [Candidatus Omnitrophota bacterium]